MRVWKYSEPTEDGKHTVTYITEAKILDQHWPWWSEKMRSTGRTDLMTEENCIQDFVTIFWADEVKEGDCDYPTG